MRKLKFLAVAFTLGTIVYSCGDGPNNTPKQVDDKDVKSANVSNYDPKRGEGKYDASNVTLGPIDAAQAKEGHAIAETKCLSCHKPTEEKLVGPGWKGVTTRRAPHWIMNFITNPDPMIDKDPAVQSQYELCLVRMPNQNLDETQARKVLEFMRENDSK